MRRYWYETLKASTHEELTKFINEAAEQGWEPVQCWSDRSSNPLKVLGDTQYGTEHFCLMRISVEAAAGAKR